MSVYPGSLAQRRPFSRPENHPFILGAGPGLRAVLAQASSLTPSRGQLAEQTQWAWVTPPPHVTKDPDSNLCGVGHRVPWVKP